MKVCQLIPRIGSLGCDRALMSRASERIPMEKTRRQFTPQQKVAISREHLVERVPVSDLCDKHKLHPTLFYQWQKAFFENGAAAFESRQSGSPVFVQRRG